MPATTGPLTRRALREQDTRPGNGGMDIDWVDASFLTTLRPASRE